MDRDKQFTELLGSELICAAGERTRSATGRDQLNSVVQQAGLQLSPPLGRPAAAEQADATRRHNGCLPYGAAACRGGFMTPAQAAETPARRPAMNTARQFHSDRSQAVPLPKIHRLRNTATPSPARRWASLRQQGFNRRR